MKYICRTILLLIISFSTLCGQDNAPKRERPEELLARLKRNLVKYENGDVCLEMKPSKFCEDLFNSINRNGTGVWEAIFMYLLYLDPEMDAKSYIEGLEKKSWIQPWFLGLREYFKRMGFKRVKTETLIAKRIPDRAIMDCIDEGMPVPISTESISKFFTEALTQRSALRKETANIDDWIAILKKSPLPRDVQKVGGDMGEGAFIVGYNKKSKEYLLKIKLHQWEFIEYWATSDEMQKVLGLGKIHLLTLQ